MTPPPPPRSDEPITKISGSYLVFRDEAIRVAGMLDEIVLTSRKRADLYDAGRILRGEQLAYELRDLADHFTKWPTLPAAQVHEERQTLGAALVLALRESLALLESMPTVGTLGAVRRIR